MGVGVDLGYELYICATVVSAPLKETEGWLQQLIYCIPVVPYKAWVVAKSRR